MRNTICAALTAITLTLCTALAPSMRQFGQALTKIGNLPANPTNEPKENK